MMFNHLWSADDDARLIDMIDAGRTYSQIARSMGVSRNSVAGRAFRLSGKHLHYVRPTRARETGSAGV